MESSRSGSDRPLYAVPEHLRNQLAAPSGIVLTDTDDILRELSGSDFVVSVGDIVTLNLLESGKIPDISIVDFMTKRESISEIAERFSPFKQEEIRVRNPAGEITKGLWDAIENAYRNPRHLRIIVEGEEDLAALVCIVLAPENTTVIYGIPNRGASIHHVDEKLKRLVRDTLDKMKISC